MDPRINPAVSRMPRMVSKPWQHQSVRLCEGWKGGMCAIESLWFGDQWRACGTCGKWGSDAGIRCCNAGERLDGPASRRNCRHEQGRALMTAAELLAGLRVSGVEINVREGRLRLVAPTGALTPTLRDRLREHKAALIAEIAGSGPPVRQPPRQQPNQRHAGTDQDIEAKWCRPPPDAVHVRTTEETRWHDWIRDRHFKLPSGTIGYAGDWKSWPMSAGERATLKQLEHRERKAGLRGAIMFIAGQFRWLQDHQYERDDPGASIHRNETRDVHAQQRGEGGVKVWAPTT